MIPADRPGEETERWHAYATPRTELRDDLVREFARHQQAEPPALLAVFSCPGGRYALVQPPDASRPRLLRAGPRGWADATVALDLHREPSPGPEFFVGGACLDAAGRRLAYTVDPTGEDRYVVRVKDLADPGGEPVHLATDAGAGVVWERHHDAVVFAELDDTLRPARVRTAGTAGSGRLLYEAMDPSEYLDLTVSSDGGTVFLARESHTTRSVLRLDPAGLRFEPLLPGPVPGASPGLRAFADAAGGRTFVLVTDDEHTELLVEERAGGVPRWRTLATAPEGHPWEEFTVLDGAVLVVERDGRGQRCLRIDPQRPSDVEVTVFDDHPGDRTGDRAASVSLVPGTGHDGSGAHLLRGTWAAPTRWYRAASDGRRADPDPPAPGTVPVTGVEEVGLTAVSADGVQVPLTLLRPPGHAGPLPTVLYAYGAYGVPVDPAYSPFRTSLLARGVAFAVAHVRGGGDRGPAWHAAGRGRHKHRAVDDLLACARTLVGEGWTPPGALAARARSAGGAIVGAALNREPRLFAAVALENPFVDCLATLSDPDAALTTLEWEEWGNPLADPEAREALAALSPVDSVRPGPYPPLLLTAGLADRRVPPREVFRFADAVRGVSTSPHPVLVKIDDAGHGGHSDADADRRDEADVLGFLLDHLLDHPLDRDRDRRPIGATTRGTR